jgi:hypothetical protein
VLGFGHRPHPRLDREQAECQATLGPRLQRLAHSAAIPAPDPRPDSCHKGPKASCRPTCHGATNRRPSLQPPGQLRAVRPG